MYRCGTLAILTAWVVFGQEIHLKTRTIQTAPEAPGSVQPGNRAGVHRMVQFDHFPSSEDLQALLAEGGTVVSVLPDNAVVVAAPGGNVTARAGIIWNAALDPADKLSAALGNAAAITAIVEFHPDVSQGAQDTVVAAEGITLLRPAVLVANHAIVVASPAELNALASHDEVAYIFPADPGLVNGDDLSPCAGMLTLAGPVAQYANIVHGWDLDSGAAHLGYVFGSITPKVPGATVRSEVLRALNEWSKYTNVTFQLGTDPSASRTVRVTFASGAHGDAYPFDGAGRVLAHTFYPVPLNPESIAGDMHLNADADWHAGGDIDIYSVALHEAGHAIGLGHSDNPGDVMYPYYRSRMSLSANDIGAAEALYGVPGVVSTTPPAPIMAPITAPIATPPVSGGTPAPVQPSPLYLTLNPVSASTTATPVTMTGTVSGGTLPVSVQWQTDQGYSGAASITNTGATNPVAWTTGAIALANGSNTVSVTAFDAARQTASQTANVTLAPSLPTSASNGPVRVAISSPASAVTTVDAPTISLSGTASGGAGVARVTWETSGGTTGTATGVAHWTAASVPMLEGSNTIIVRAYDAGGASGWSALIVVRH